MYAEILDKMTHMKPPRVLLAGDFMLDKYIYGDALRISPEAPVPVLKVIKQQYRCGGGASVAANLSALGATAVCLGVTGNDSDAAVMREMLEKQGSDTSGLFQCDDRPTTCKHRLIGLAQHKHRQQLIRFDQESSEDISEDTAARALDFVRKVIDSVDIVCIQDYRKGFITQTVSQGIIQIAAERGIKVIVDPPLTDDYSKFAGAFSITPNRSETAAVCGFEITSVADAQRAAEQLVKKYKLASAVITLDRDGALFYSPQQSQYVPTIARTVYDVTGAGDMVIAALAVSLGAGMDYREALEISNIAGGLEVEKFGTASVSIDEIINELSARVTHTTGKLIDDRLLKNIVNFHRNCGHKIVFTNGCFDVLHRGHVEYLKYTRTLGDIVILGLNSDSSIRKLKGPDRPINNELDRAAVLAGLESIDYIVIFEDDTPLRLLDIIKPDVLVKGGDQKIKENVVGWELVESHGGRVVVADLIEGKSSTDTIRKIKASADQENK